MRSFATREEGHSRGRTGTTVKPSCELETERRRAGAPRRCRVSHKFIQFGFKHCGIFFLPNKGVCCLVKREGPGDFAVVHAGGLQDQLGLEQESVLALQAGPREKDDPGNVAGMHGKQRRNQATSEWPMRPIFLASISLRVFR